MFKSMTAQLEEDRYGLLIGKGFFQSKKNIEARLRFTKLHLNKPADFWNNETRTTFRGNQQKDLRPVQHGGGGMVVWGCSAATGPELLVVIGSCSRTKIQAQQLMFTRTIDE